MSFERQYLVHWKLELWGLLLMLILSFQILKQLGFLLYTYNRYFFFLLGFLSSFSNVWCNNIDSFSRRADVRRQVISFQLKKQVRLLLYN